MKKKLDNLSFSCYLFDEIKAFVVIMIKLFAIRNLISLIIILVEGTIIFGETKG